MLDWLLAALEACQRAFTGGNRGFPHLAAFESLDGVCGVGILFVSEKAAPLTRTD